MVISVINLFRFAVVAKFISKYDVEKVEKYDKEICAFY